jgi:hypothetical protein
MALARRVFRVRAFGPLGLLHSPGVQGRAHELRGHDAIGRARLLEAVLWKPAIRWRVHRIHVLNRSDSRRSSATVNGGRATLTAAQNRRYRAPANGLRRRGIAPSARHCPRGRRLRHRGDVHAHAACLRRDNVADSRRCLRAGSKGQWFHPPYLGCREVCRCGGACRPCARSRSRNRWASMLHDLGSTTKGAVGRVLLLMLRDGGRRGAAFRARRARSRLGGGR